MSEEMKLMCDRLSHEEKVELRNYLSRQITLVDNQRKTPLRGSILLGEMADILGEDIIPSTCQEPKYVWARSIVAYQMSLEGYKTTEIGRQLMRSHSDVVHMRKRMQDALSLPIAYQDIVAMWDLFQNRIQ